MKTRIVTSFVLLLCTHLMYAQSKYTSTDFATKNPGQTYVGAVMKASSLNQESHQFLSLPLHPVIISFSNLMKSCEITPSYDNMMQAISSSLQESGTIKQISSLSYSFAEYSSYNELALFYRQKVDAAKLLGLPDTRKQRKTLVILNFELTLFTADMDLPEALVSDPKALEPFAGEELIYINSIGFGRRALMFVESDYPYADIKAAVDYTIKKAGSDDTAINEKHEAVFANSSVRVITPGNNVLGEDDPSKPLRNLVEYMTKAATVDDFGIPISFSASNLKDHGVFANEYTLQ